MGQDGGDTLNAHTHTLVLHREETENKACSQRRLSRVTGDPSSVGSYRVAGPHLCRTGGNDDQSEQDSFSHGVFI